MSGPPVLRVAAENGQPGGALERRLDAVGDPVVEDAQEQPGFFNGSKFVPARLGLYLQDESTLRLGHDDRLYRYVDGVYRGDGDKWARARARDLLGQAYRRGHVDEAVSWLRATMPQLGEAPPVEFINVRNGLLHWPTGELRPHSPEVASTVQLPVEWRPSARCPGVERFLGEVLPEDAVGMMHEVIGYALYAGNPLRKAVMLLGPGGNGKSVLLSIVEALVGSENTAAVPLQALGENRFAAAELFGKLANICGDLDARALKRTDHFKMLTGGDPVLAERKYAQPFSFRSIALPIFSANEAPASSDQSQAFFDRWIIVPMEARFEGTRECDPHLRDKLTAPDELAGLLVLAVAAGRRLLQRGHFELPESVRSAGECYRERLDTVRSFVEEACDLRDDEWTPRPDLHRAYTGWAREGGHWSLSAATFNEHLRRNFPQLQESTRRGIRGWSGIAPRASEQVR